MDTTRWAMIVFSVTSTARDVLTELHVQIVK